MSRKKKPLALITGASGFLGLHLVRVLQDAGYAVRSLGRSAHARLEALEVDQHLGSVTDAEVVAKALKGVACVYHLAGYVSRDKDDRGPMYDVHVKGTRTVLRACLDAGIDKVVVVSTSGTVGVSEKARVVATEDSDVPWKVIGKWPYYESKAFQEKEVFDAVKRGLPVKLARPTLLLGPGDHNGSSTGDVVKFLCGDIKAALPGGMSFVDARDVAACLPALMEKGEPGVGYLLGAANCTVHDFLLQLAQVSGLTPPTFTLPRSLVDSPLNGLLKKSSEIRMFGGLEPQTFEMGCAYWYIDWTRAQDELGFAPRPPAETLRDTVDDLRNAGRT